MNPKLGYLVALAACLFASGLFVEGMLQHQQESMLNSQGIRVPGRVLYARNSGTGMGTGRNDSRQDDFFLDVSYSVQGVPTERWFECTLLAMDTHPQGSSVTVIYDPADPSKAMLGENLNSESSGWAFYAAAVVFLIGLLAFVYVRQNSKPPDDDTSAPAPADKPHWTNDPLADGDPGDIPTK